MRFHAIAENLLASPSRLAVVRALTRHPDRAWTGRELARAAGVSPRWAILTLRSLEAEGLVLPERVPPAVRWTVNRKHALMVLLEPALRVDEQARALARGALFSLVSPLRPVSAIWFGSTATGGDRATSDIDLLVVVRAVSRKEEAERVLEQAVPRFYGRFGSRLAPVVLSQREFDARKHRGFAASAVAHGEWLVGGEGDA